MKTIAICGLGGSGREVLDLIERTNNGRWSNIIFCDKNDDLNIFEGYPVYTFEKIANQYTNEEIEFVISVGDIVLREKIYKQINNAGYDLATVIASNVYVPKNTKIENGVIIRDNCYISVGVVIRKNSMIQPNSTIGHDVVINENSIISAHTVIAGGVEIGKNVYIGIGCNIKELATIGDDTIVSMGSSVNIDLPSNIIAQGNPAQVISKNYLKSAFLLNRLKKNEKK